MLILKLIYVYIKKVQIQPYRQLCPSEGMFGSPTDCQTFVKCNRDARGILNGKILNMNIIGLLINFST